MEKAENGNNEYKESESAMKRMHICFGSFVPQNKHVYEDVCFDLS